MADVSRAEPGLSLSRSRKVGLRIPLQEQIESATLP